MTMLKIASFSGGSYTAEIETNVGTVQILRADLVDNTDYLNKSEIERQAGDLSALTASISGVNDSEFVYRPEDMQDEYFLAPAPLGNDGNAGTSTAAPWETWPHAAGILLAGDILTMMTGTHGNFFGGGVHDLTFAGQDGLPIVIRAQAGTVPYISTWVNFRGSWGIVDGIHISYAFSFAEYTIIKNCKFTPPGGVNALKIQRDHGWLQIIDSEFDGSTQSGIDNTGSQSIVVRGCHIHDCVRALQMKGGTLDVIVEGCLIHDITGGTFVGYAMTAVPGCVTTGSAYCNDPATAIADRYHGSHLIIRNNVVYNDSSWGCFRMGGWRHCEIYNNTIVNFSGSIVYVVEGQTFEFLDATALAHLPHVNCGAYCAPAACNKIALHTNNITIKNNIHKDIGGGVILQVNTSSTVPTIDYNLIDDAAYTDDTHPAIAYTTFGVNRTLANFRAVYGQETNTVLQAVTLNAGDDYSGGPAGGVALLSDVRYDYDWVARTATPYLGAH